MTEILFARKIDVDTLLASIAGALNAPYLTYSADANLTAERVATSSTSVLLNVATPNVATWERAALTGDVTATQNSNATTIAPAAVTYSKMQNVAAQRLLGNPTGSVASPSEISLTGDTNVAFSFVGSALTVAWAGTLAAARLNSNVVQSITNDTNVTGSIGAQNLTLGWTGTLAAGRLNANVVQSITNDTNVTGTIAAQNLTLGWTGTLANARLANMADSTVKGRHVGGGTGAPEDLSAQQVLDVINSLATITITAGSSGSEGGELHFLKPPSGSTLSGDVAIDINTNKVRIFETGGTNRGAFIDLTSAAAGVGTNLLVAAGSGTVTRRTISGADTAGLTDKGNLIEVTSGTFSLAFTAAATLTNGWWTYIYNHGTGDVTLDPNGAELIDGLTTWVLYPGGAILVQTDGTAFRSILLAPMRKQFDASGTFTKPGVGTFIRVEGWGSGASGGRSNSNTAGIGAGGGGGGSYLDRTFPFSAFGTTETVTIATGGAVVTTGQTNGNQGGSTTVGSFFTTFGGGAGGSGANGVGVGGGGAGVRGAGVNASGATLGVGGPPRIQTTTSAIFAFGGSAGGGSGGDTAQAGGHSHTGGGGGAGGINAATGPAGGDSLFGGGGGGGVGTTTGGAGGVSVHGGNGGAAGVGAAAATAGSQPGGGGGGSQTGNSGAGGDGRVIIYVW